MGSWDRKQEIVDKCLETFMKNGLAHTSTKDLCDALNLNSGGVFYWFDSKDDIVIACAEEAKKRIERDLFGIAMEDLENPEKLLNDLQERAIAMRPMMKFFVTVCSTPEYEEDIHHSLNKLNIRYKNYVEQIAKKLCARPEDVAPYVYITINMMLSYMLFGKTNFIAPQLELVYSKLTGLLENKNNNDNKPA